MNIKHHKRAWMQETQLIYILVNVGALARVAAAFAANFLPAVGCRVGVRLERGLCALRFCLWAHVGHAEDGSIAATLITGFAPRKCKLSVGRILRGDSAPEIVFVERYGMAEFR